MAPIHDRMPAILERSHWPLWLGEAEGEALPILRPAGEGLLRAWPISRAVNSVQNYGADILAPARQGSEGRT